MNKKLIALAVAGAFALPLAAAAAESNVTIYGKADIALDNVDPGTAAAGGSNSGYKRSRVSSGNSLLGFKGTEDLGNGLAAVFQIEQNVNLDDGSTPGVTSGTFNRATFAGLTGKSWGTVTLGIQDTPYKTAASGKLDPFSDTIGDYNAIFNRDVRATNSVKYVTPDFSGFSASILWSAANEGAAAASADNQDGKFLSVNGVYANGPIYVTVAHERSRAYAASATAATEYKANKIGGSYTFGDATVGAVWEKYTDDSATTPVAFSAATGRRTDWTINGVYNIGAVALKAAYVKAGKQENIDNSDASQWTLGAYYSFSKRTQAYALYTRMDNKDGASYGLGQGGTSFSASGAGADPKGLALGMKHTF